MKCSQHWRSLRLYRMEIKSKFCLAPCSSLQVHLLRNFIHINSWTKLFCDLMDCSPPCSFVHEIFDKNTGVDWYFPLQGIFLTQGSNTHLLCLLHWKADSLLLSHLGSLIYGKPHVPRYSSKEAEWYCKERKGLNSEYLISLVKWLHLSETCFPPFRNEAIMAILLKSLSGLKWLNTVHVTVLGPWQPCSVSFI